MHARTPLFALLGIFFLLVVPMSVQAQDSNDTSELAKQLSALQTMNRTVGPMIANANSRKRQMNAFIEKKGLQAEWNSFAETASKPPELSFDEGYKVALQRAQTEQHTAVSNESASDLAGDISATKTMVQDEWSTYSGDHELNTQMTAFIQSKNLMPEYDTYTQTFAKQRASVIQQRINAQNEKESSAAKQIYAKFQAQQRYLMQHWDEEMHLKGLATSSGYILERNRRSIVADSHQYPYLDSQTQPVLWAPQGGGYWGGSWGGGHADPYYDVNGFPNSASPPAAAQKYKVHPAYDRTETPVYHPSAISPLRGTK